MRVAVLGASGTIGRRVLEHALDRGHAVTAQTRSPDKLADLFERVRVMKFAPWDPSRYPEFLKGQDAVVFALGIDHPGPTTLFSDVSRLLIAEMAKAGVRRLVAVTGVGAGETRGHGGAAYDWFIYPLFTRRRYRDKDLQEKLIQGSDLDWTIVRPARFETFRPTRPLHIVTRIEPKTVLRRITPDEVAAFIVAQLPSSAYVHECPFIGHP
jgi:putative NADH-flavin reductase